MALEITEVLDVGDDVLVVRAKDGDDEYEARGWVSATKNHFGDADYDADGNLKDKAKPKKMTKAQVGEYALRLIREQNPDLAKPKKITFA